MYPLALFLLLHASLSSPRLLHSLPEDPYAYPKFRVAFLNAPVLNETAQSWFTQGLRGGQSEFLDHPSSVRKEIGGTDAVQNHDDNPSLEPLPITTANYTLEHMKLGPRDSYICLIPEPPDISPPTTEDVSDSEVSPARSWSLLHPLDGTCLYHRQGWFTYSYCHNREIRQFKELIQPNSHHILGAYKPEEDPDWESYTLGKAPANPGPGAELSVAEQDARSANFELARNAASRYLVQRWGDGSVCDKTGKRREVEVQFHCSMTMTDTILFVKEAKTCSYVLVIHTPRLCGEPGFRSRLESTDEAQISCREIIPDPTSESETTTSSTTSPASAANTKIGQASIPLPVADYPLKSVRHKPVPPSPSAAKVGAQARVQGSKDKVYEELIRKTLEALFSADTRFEPGESRAMEEEAHDNVDGNEVVIELVGDPEVFDGQSETMERLADALRVGGYNVKADKTTAKAKTDDKEDGEESHGTTANHNEL